ncbi:hypothetical protein C492_22542 [Natronococcus jeotgali DSM 18795]|uniref:Uncharacterized protein n=1 Tax=Natronococcus jeotgali DSM 18795 TaxID=1227498 RepID=L9WMI8_9EURY|nr:hypothetical protein C492_22542 [Natronococcus jeotgali DSM 18795]
MIFTLTDRFRIDLRFLRRFFLFCGAIIGLFFGIALNRILAALIGFIILWLDILDDLKVLIKAEPFVVASCLSYMTPQITGVIDDSPRAVLNGACEYFDLDLLARVTLSIADLADPIEILLWTGGTHLRSPSFDSVYLLLSGIFVVLGHLLIVSR